MDRIVLKQIGQIAKVSQIVDRHHLDVGQFHGAAQHHAANAPKPVNPNATDHHFSPIS